MVHEKLKVKDLLAMEQCERKAFYNTLNLSNYKGKAYHSAIVMKNFLKNFSIGNTSFHSDKMIEKYAEESLPDDLYVFRKEKDIDVRLFVNQIKRYLEYERMQNRKLLTQNVNKEVQFFGQNVTVSADAIFLNKISEDKEVIEVVTFKRSSPKMTYGGRKRDTSPSCSIDLYFMQQLGMQLYPGKSVKASLYHLSSKNDSTEEFKSLFEELKGSNIISYQFETDLDTPMDTSDLRYGEQLKSLSIEERIKRLLETNVSNESNKNCDKSNCEICEFSNICNYVTVEDVELEVLEEKESEITKLNLSKPQKEAVKFTSGIVRILAGAGAGKTSVLTLRFINLLKNGVSPNDILMITFTNKGALEMKERIKKWLKFYKMEHIDVNKLNILTFNSFGDRLLRENYEIFGFDKEPVLIDNIEKYDIIIDLLSRFDNISFLNYKTPLLNMIYAKGAVIELSEIFATIKSKGYKNIKEFAKDTLINDSDNKLIWEMYQVYNEELTMKGFIEYQDQIRYTLELIQVLPEAMRKYAAKHIMVDEFQDTDKLQLDILKGLSKQSIFESLMVVGDDSQSIFRFRHVSQEFIVNFHNFFDDVIDINLLENHRSTPEILSLANALNSLNTVRIEKELCSMRDSGTLPVLKDCTSIEEEYGYIVDVVKENIAKGVPMSELAIITKTKAELLEIQELLKYERIPTYLDVPELVISNKNVRIILSFAKFLRDTSYNYNLYEYIYMCCQEKLDGMLTKDIKHIAVHQKARFMKSFAALTTEKAKFNYFFQLMAPIRKRDAVVNKFLNDLQKKDFAKFDDLVDYLIKYERYENNITVEKEDIKYNAVNLITAHSSKGKEYEVVINSINKYKYSGKRVTKESLEEERRLLFVSITRAKKSLYITCTEKKKALSGFSYEIREILTRYLATA